MPNLCILGATGSIGDSTLDVVARHPDKYNVVALSAHKRLEKLISLAQTHQPEYLVVSDPSDVAKTQQLSRDAGLNAKILAGNEGLCEVASLDNVDTVMAAIVGAAGLLPTLAAVKAGKKVLLANKESLVMSGELFMAAVRENNALLLPIDSEHNAIFQCMPVDFVYGDLNASGINKILLTGSGGPFLSTPLDELEKVTPAQACKHPNWDMGRKISVDSATMMNKGLEFIEACWLFGVGCDDIQVVLHPQSVIHSMVQYKDGSVLAQMGNPDMRTPIAHCLAYPDRITSGVEPLDFSTLTDFSFTTPDFTRYPNLKLAMDACQAGQYATTSLNAANEVAVEAFLNEQIGFTDIIRVNEAVLTATDSCKLETIEQVLAHDQLARKRALEAVTKVGSC